MGNPKDKAWAPPTTDTEVKETKSTWTPPSTDLPADEKKNDLPSTSESTVDPLVSAAPSTGKIKEQNVKNLDFDRSNIIKDRIAKTFPGLGETGRQSFVNTLVKNGYKKEAIDKYVSSLGLPETPESKAKLDEIISKTLPYDPTGPITDWATDFVKKSATKIGEGGDLFNKGIQEMIDATGSSDATPASKVAHDLIHGGLTSVKGGGQIAMNTIPAAVGFNAGVDAIKTVADKNLSKDHAETVGKVLDAPFTLVSKTANALGIKPEEGSNSALLLELADFVATAGVMHGIGKAGEHISDIKNAPKSLAELKDLSQKAAEGKLTPEEQTQYNDIAKGMDKVSLPDIKAQAEKVDTPAAKEIVAKINEATKESPVDHDELHNDLAALQAKTQEPDFDKLPPEVQAGIQNDIKAKTEELVQKSQDQVDAHTQEATMNAQVADIDAKINEVSKSMEGTDGAVKESIKKTIEGLQKQKDEILTQKPTENAIQEQSASSVLQYPQEGVGESGSGRGGMEPVNSPGAAKVKEETPVQSTETEGIAHSEETAQEGESEPPVKPPKEKPATEPEEEKKIGIKQKDIDSDREEQKLDPIEKKARQGNEERWDRVKQEVESGEVSPKHIAQSVVDKPRTITDDEVSALAYDRIKLSNKRDGIMTALEKAQESGDKDRIHDATLRLAEVNEDIDTNDRALHVSGSETGSALQMRQAIFKKDFSLAALERKAKIANGGETLPKETLEKLKTLSEEIEAHKKVIDSLEEDRRQREAQKSLDDILIEKKVQEGIDKQTQEIAEKFFSKETKGKVDDAFKNIESKIKKLYNSSSANSSIVAIPLNVLEGAVKLTHTLTLRGMDLANAVKHGLDELKDFKGKFEEKDFKELFDELKEHVKVKEGRSRDTESILKAAKKRAEKQGKLPGLNNLLKRYVGDGITDINKMVDKVYDDFKDQFPELTKRQVRDEISGYGKVTELSKDAIDMQLRKMKRIGSLISGLEDAKNKRIKRTGLQRDVASSEEIKLRKEINNVMRENQLTGDNNPKSETEWKSLLDKYKSRLKNKTEELENKLKVGDFSKKTKVPLVLDAEALEAKKKYNKVKDEITKEIKKVELSNRSGLEKTKDNFLKYRRALILSSLTTTVGKLGIAAGFRTFVSTPLESALAAGWSKVPIIRDIANGAPRYGGEFSPEALAKGFAKWFEKATYLDTKDILKGEKGELSSEYGHDDEISGGLLDVFNQIHKAIKNPAKKAEFATSLQKRMENAIRQGENPYDPVVQSRIAAEAYEDSNRAVYLQKNKITSGYETFVRTMESKAKDGGVTGQIVAAMTRFLLPIIKVPTNFVAEQREYVAGITNMQVAIRKGIENLTPAERDHVIRGLTRQTIGVGALLLGYYGYKHVGGYYRKGQKDDDLKPDDLDVLGIKIPHWAQHVPVIQSIQFGATVRRVQEYYAAKDAGKPEDQQSGKGIGAGIGSAAVGTLEHVPFLETPGQMMEALRTPEGRDKWVGQLAKSLLIPPDVEKITKYFDKDLDGNEIIRKPKGFLETLEMGIPGLRQRVGDAFDEATKKRSDPSSDEMIRAKIHDEKDPEKIKELQHELQENKISRRETRTSKEVNRELELMKLAKALGKIYIPPKAQSIREKSQIIKMLEK